MDSLTKYVAGNPLPSGGEGSTAEEEEELPKEALSYLRELVTGQPYLEWYETELVEDI